MKLNLIFFLSFCNLLAVHAQETPEVWTLQECVDYALEHNLQVKTSALQARINENNLEAVWWQSLSPSLSAFSNAGWNFGLNIDPVTNEISESRRFTSSLSLSTQWVLFDGFRKYNSIAQNNYQYIAGLYDLEAIENDVRLNVASAFLQVLLNREILAVALEQEKISILQVNQTQKLVEAGAAPRGNLLQFQAQLARDEQNTVAARNAVMISKLQLASLLQLPRLEDFQVADPELDIPEAAVLAQPPAQVFDQAVQNQPAIKAAQERIKSSEEAVDLSFGGYLPRLSLQGQVSTSYSDRIREPTGLTEVEVPVPIYINDDRDVDHVPQIQVIPAGFENKAFTDQLEDNVNEYIGFNLSVPIFNQMQVKNNLQNSKIQYQISQLQLEQERQQLRQSIYQSHADALASYNSYLAAEKAVQSSKESFAYAEERYGLGAINQFDYENAKNSLAVAQSEMLRSKYDYIFKIKLLEFYLTNQIKL